jgi:hypothetical protein
MYPARFFEYNRGKSGPEDFAMHVTLVHVSVKPVHITDFIEATRRNHEASVQELGNRCKSARGFGADRRLLWLFFG